MTPSAGQRGDAFAAGQTVAGRFEIVRPIARGAMGAVFEARDRARDRAPVALKVLLASLGHDPAARRRFRREATVLSALAHPVLVRVVAHGLDEGVTGVPWLAMELVAGETLAERIRRRGRLDPPEVAGLLDALAEGLAAVHERGIVHGDVKPENVLLEEGAEEVAGTGAGAAQPGVRLVDFGLAKVEGLERLTRTGELSGTPAYLPPELVTGEAPLDQRADVYGLGVVLYEALGGRPPYAGKHPGKLLFAVAAGDRPALSGLRADLPGALVAVVDRALSRTPGDRPPDAPTLAEAFRSAMAGRE